MREVFYGGAAGGGKSDALLMAALQYVDQPGYAALLMRRNFKQLNMPGALMNRAHEWLDHTSARWHGGNKQWTFPSGATLTFGFIGPGKEDREKYASAEFQFIGLDELTQFEEGDYRFMFSRLRRRAGIQVPLRMRSASNPGGRGAAWVKERFVDPRTRLKRAAFIPAFLHDNPHLDRDEYIESLRELHPILWRRLLHGDWSAMDPGEIFQPRIWLDDTDWLTEPPIGKVPRVRYWDLAASEPTSENPDPDWTVGARFSRMGKLYVVEHLVRFRHTPGTVEQMAKTVTLEDPAATVTFIEQEPGSAGKGQVSHYRRNVLGPLGRRVRPDKVTGDKVTRAGALAAAMEGHRVKFVRGEWVSALFDEMEAFPDGGHDDQVDACSGAFNMLRRAVGATGTTAARSA